MKRRGRSLLLCLTAWLAPCFAAAQGLSGPFEAAAVGQARTFDGVGQSGGSKPAMTVLGQAAGAEAPLVAPATRMPKGTGLQATPVPASGKAGRGWPPRSRTNASFQDARLAFGLAFIATVAIAASFPTGLPLAAALGVVGAWVAAWLYVDYRNGELPWQKRRGPKA